ncbi:RfbC dTDP-4-dehydrorhamnose 3,5-epimerase and related enzymes [Burkholderiaceae bacterium]
MNIDGVITFELKEIDSNLGSVLHMLRNDAPGFVRFGEVYFSEVLPKSVKAWKRHLRQTQNICVPIGRIRLVIFDPRMSSSTRGNLFEVELGRPDAYLRIQIPPGLWYGFKCLSETPALLANCVDYPHELNEGLKMPIIGSEIPYSWEA